MKSLVNSVDFKDIAIEPLSFPLPIKNLLAYKGACEEDQTTGYFHVKLKSNCSASFILLEILKLID
ncbi:hypothetical protein MtrunA17_Chr8g0339981 [Medicago truncatula]|uniref:Uncharacterized protein n=1 Tax=Medicago truncatula TaxID=3880 RepID=A0A396GJZ2_MEDTR|nr:hypothetical protein MtrunA17_Chr8g0339981 [Medicago truncatula]